MLKVAEKVLVTKGCGWCKNYSKDENEWTCTANNGCYSYSEFIVDEKVKRIVRIIKEESENGKV